MTDAAYQSIRLTAEKLEGEDDLRVFLEPADSDVRGSGHVIQLDVSIKNYIGESATDGPSAVEKSHLPCTSSLQILSTTSPLTGY
jgi:hypothetical protein